MGETLSVAVGSVTRLDRNVGMKGHMAVGMLVGAALGAGIGSAVAPEEGSGYSQDYAKGVYFLGGAAAGLLLGGAVGSAIRSERWETLLPGSWRLGLDHDCRDTGVRISFRF